PPVTAPAPPVDPPVWAEPVAPEPVAPVPIIAVPPQIPVFHVPAAAAAPPTDEITMAVSLPNLEVTQPIPGATSMPYGDPDSATTLALAPQFGGIPPVRHPAHPQFGTVYGGQSGQPTTANAESPLEQSGSLTGLILSRGAPGHIQEAEHRSRMTKV